MEKRIRVTSLAVVVLLLLTSLAAFAQANKDAVITINGGTTAVYMKAPEQSFVPAAPHSAKLVTIYSNFGPKGHTYDGSVGYGILGTDAGQPWTQSVGCGFKPKANHTVTEIQVGVTYVQGTNTMVLSLREDKNHRPGKVLHSWHFSNLPTFGTCCTLQTAKYAKGIPVTKDKMYWVVVAPDPKYQDTYDVWNNAFNDPQGPFSNNIGSGWAKQSLQTLTNFGVFGK